MLKNISLQNNIRESANKHTPAILVMRGHMYII